MAGKKKTNTKKATTRPRKKKTIEEEINIDPTNVVDVLKQHEEEVSEAVEQSEQETEERTEQVEEVQEASTEVTEEEVILDEQETVEEETTLELEPQPEPKDEKPVETPKKKLNPTKVTRGKRLWNYYWNGTTIE